MMKTITYAGYKSEWDALINARHRCHNENCSAYFNYGGRGISVHPDWMGKEGVLNFIAHIGAKPSPELTLDRIDNDGNYEPGNVRWATRKEQIANQRPRKPHYTMKRCRDRDRDICDAFSQGVTRRELAARFDLSVAQIGRIIKKGIT